MAKGWTKEQKEALFELVRAGGLSYAEMAQLINERFGTQFSRDAAIGAAFRAGLMKPPPRLTAAQRAQTLRARYDRRNERKREERRMARENQPAKSNVVEFRCEPVEPRHVSLLDLKPEECRYPYGLSDYTFCGQPALSPSSKRKKNPYCPAHTRLTERTGPYAPTSRAGVAA